MIDFLIEPLTESIYEQAKNFVEANEKYSVLLSAMISSIKVPDKISPQGDIFCIFKIENGKKLVGVFGITYSELILHNIPFLFENQISNTNEEILKIVQKNLIEKLSAIIKGRNVFSIMGEANSSDIFCKACEAAGKKDLCKYSYILMEYNDKNTKMDFSKFSPQNLLQKELFIRACSPLDAESLYPLQKEYDIIEVLPPKMYHDEFVCKMNLKRNLAHHLIYAVFYGNKAVAKAGTNAIGTFYFQIGGVFTEKQWRNKQLAQAVVSAVVKEALAQGKKTVLFVKTQNEPAKAVYTNIGFEPCGNYKICYFEKEFRL